MYKVIDIAIILMFRTKKNNILKFNERIWSKSFCFYQPSSPIVQEEQNAIFLLLRLLKPVTFAINRILWSKSKKQEDKLKNNDFKWLVDYPKEKMFA